MKPLTDLHLHLDGALRPSTMLQLAAEDGVTLPAADEAGLRAALKCGEIRASVAECLSFFGTTLSVMQTRRGLARVARELFEDCGAIGLRYVEFRFSPLLHTQRELSAAEAVETVIEAIDEGQKALGHRLTANVILCSLWHFTPRETELVAALGMAYFNKLGGVVGLDMAGNEMDSSIRAHAKHLRKAKERGLGLTIHAGESGPAERVLEAIEAVEPQRIGHATRAGDRPDIIERMADAGVTVEACPSSNAQTRVTKAFDAYPLRTLLDRGVGVCLNSDDPLMMDTDAGREFDKARAAFGLTPEEEKRLHLHGIEASFATVFDKNRLREELERRLAPQP